jgi:cell division protease FtsH
VRQLESSGGAFPAPPLAGRGISTWVFMPNFSSLLSSITLLRKNAKLRTALFGLLLLSAIIISIEGAPKLLPSSPVVYSQDVSLIASLPAQRERLDFLLIAQPTSESPRYVIKYKDQKKMLAVKVPNSTHVNLEREVLLRNGIPYAIAQPDWLNANPQILHDQATEEDFWSATGGFLVRNAIGIVLLVLMVAMLRKSLPGMGASASVIMPEKLKGSMDDLVGMADIKREVAHLEAMIENRELYKSHNIDRPFNVMLTGPAGTGKTKLAGYLAKQLNIPLIQASGSGLESGLVGGGSKTLNAIHKKAVAQGRCLIFLDEAQSLFMPRGRGERKWDDDTANTLLGLLDGIKSDEGRGVIWVVASNFDDANSEMDEAMLRRFSVKINFRLPNKAERRDLLSVFLRRKDTHVVDWDQLNLDEVAEITANLSPALLETVVDRASMIAIEEKIRIDTRLLFRAFERSAIGLTDRAASAEKDKQRERVALHELGHFFMQIDPLLRQGLSLDAVKQKSSLLKISTESVSKLGALGYVLSATPEAGLQTLDELEQDVMQLYGGMAAEELFYGARGISVGSQNDIQKATARLEWMVNQLSMYSRSKLDYRQLKRDGAHEDSLRAVEAKADELYSQTLAAIATYRSWMEQLTSTLMERYVLSKDEVFELIAELQRLQPLNKVAGVTA